MATPETVAEPQEAPLRFGKYQLERLLARGGMGEVYQARLVGELGFEKQLVIKTILPELANKPRFIELFAAEAKTAVALSHGNIVPIYELGRSDETFYIVMGYVDGPSAAQLLRAYAKRRLSPRADVALHVVRGVLTGLAYAHREEPGRPPVVHRDISPRNVLIDRSGQVRIVDFGIALPAKVQVDLRAGSTGYMAPEQARAEAADPRADVFSTACLLYELLTLRRAFPKEGVWTPPDLSAVPEELRPVLERSLAADPDDRPSDAAAMLHALAPVIARHAAVFGDPDLAAHLRELFPQGWRDDVRPADDGELSPATGVPVVPTQTFATRLTAVTKVTKVTKTREEGSVDASPSPEAEDEPEASASVASATDRSSPREDRRRLGPLVAVAVFAAVGGGLAALAVARNSDPPVQAAVASAPEPPAPASAPPNAAPPDTSKAEPAQEPTPEPEAIALTLTTDPSDARVRVDGERLEGTSPYTVELLPGEKREAELSADGYESRRITLDPTDPKPRHVALAPKARPNGTLRVIAPTVSWARVEIDGKDAGDTPTRAISLPEGTHRVVVRCTAEVCSTERVLLSRAVKVVAGRTIKVEAK